MDILGGITGSIALVKKAMELAEKTKNLELKEAIVELQEKLIDVKGQVVELKEENLRLREAAARADAPPEVVLKEGAYFKPDGDGPFCTICFDRDERLYRVTRTQGVLRQAHGNWHCGVCKKIFGR